ncbi:hypothetical protein Y032_0002g936 [Ancylostoma ceylanicum]|uniref:Elongin-C n=1 Tax=Ancylostoma ceylanicum TaxID=53326 RepID=A0A016W1H4_9BILA|nr:hypothetical protein Y032_0002g936 [Ancylostoma ceylanicum]
MAAEILRIQMKREANTRSRTHKRIKKRNQIEKPNRFVLLQFHCRIAHPRHIIESTGTSGSSARIMVNRFAAKRPKKRLSPFREKDYDYIILVSSDGIKFYIRRELAYVSRTIRAMMSGPSNPVEEEQNIVHFRSIPSHILQKVCHYFLYKNRYEDSDKSIPEFSIEPHLSLELLMAANFLDC